MLEIGSVFPDFTLNNHEGIKKTLESYKKKWLVLFFYSKDNTSACTKEVEDFGALYADFQAAGAEVAGISRDTEKTHANFIKKLGIAYELLSDPDRSFIESIGLLKDKTMYGKPVKGVNRSTFIISPDGIIKAAWTGVKVPNHAQEVLNKLKELEA